MSKKLFEELRALAAEARDKKLAEIRAEYGQTIADIAEMEQRMIGQPVAVRPKSKADASLVDLIAAVMPGDRYVTVDDVAGLLRAADPERQFNMPTIRATMHRLVVEGTIKKLTNPQHDKKVQYCLPDFDGEPIRSLADWAEEVLRVSGKPMKSVEIMVAMTESGYELECIPAESVANLERAISTDKRFTNQDCGWIIS